MQISKIQSQDVAMEFNMENVQCLKGGKKDITERIDLLDE